jgi:hypothetical protein
VIAIQWSSYILITFVLLTTIIWPKKVILINLLFFMGFLRSVMPLFDAEERRLRGDKA